MAITRGSSGLSLTLESLTLLEPIIVLRGVIVKLVVFLLKILELNSSPLNKLSQFLNIKNGANRVVAGVSKLPYKACI